MAKKQFKAESKKLLDLMINSIYTHKEIFLRELISNSSDALDKLYYKALTSGDTGVKRNDFYIELIPDKELRTLTVRDNGIGMTQEELELNLGTIARSGSQEFKNDRLSEEDSKISSKLDIIGQFGVGFYSAFMVSDLVTVTSRPYGSEESFIWTSRGADGFTVEPASKDSHGTEIVLHIKEDTEGENYSEFLERYVIEGLVKKYSDYIRYPVKLDGDTLNSMEPIWKRQKSKVKDEEYNEYYKAKFFDNEAPCRVIRTSVEGVSSFTALLFIPGHAPYDYYTKEYEKGLQLYSSGVMIMDKCSELLPDCFNFVKGIVDSMDLSLNISRETLQHDRQLKNIAKNLEKKIKKELTEFLKNDRTGYEKFFADFGRQLKYGIYEKFGMNRELLEDLILFHSSKENRLVSLNEYLERMSEDQKGIYYAAGESTGKIDILPQTEALKEKGYEILYLTDEIDEFLMNILREYKEKPFISASDANADEIRDEKEVEKIKEETETNSELLNSIKESLSGKVSDVLLSPRLKSSPVCLTTKGDISLEMEKLINSMPFEQRVTADRVLEINPDHDIFKALKNIYDNGKNEEEIKKYASLLYDQSLLISGMTIDDPVEFSKNICELMVKASK